MLFTLNTPPSSKHPSPLVKVISHRIWKCYIFYISDFTIWQSNLLFCENTFSHWLHWYGLSPWVLEFLHFYFNLFNFCFRERYFACCFVSDIYIYIYIYIFLLVDLISKLYIVYIHYFGMCFVSGIYIFLLVDLISKLYTLFGVCFVIGIYILLADCYSFYLYS